MSVGEIIANALAPAIKVGAIVLVVAVLGTLIYLFLPKEIQNAIIGWVEWAWHLVRPK